MSIQCTAVGPREVNHRYRLGGLIAILTVAAVSLAACGSESATTSINPPVVPSSDSLPELDPERVQQGVVLYEAFCAACHGIDLAGEANWKDPNADGSLKPPPQDSTGHTWHHSDRVLLDLIANGSDFAQSRMPPFGGTLSESEILAILDYLKSSWGEQERVFQWQVSSQDR